MNRPVVGRWHGEGHGALLGLGGAFLDDGAAGRPPSSIVIDRSQPASPVLQRR
ncbi:hypothetical protein [Streptomyces mirabilis]|uniref:hypothetical protein n=1 Tax=Streptomyces mirabilis TaxID=68239 RepID=UPI003414B0F0